MDFAYRGEAKGGLTGRGAVWSGPETADLGVYWRTGEDGAEGVGL